MGDKKDRRVRKIEVPTNSVTEFELGDCGRNTVEEGGEGGKSKGGRDTETEGGDHGEGSYILARGVSGRKMCKDRQK